MPSHPDRVRRQYEPDGPAHTDESDNDSLDEVRQDEGLSDDGPDHIDDEAQSRDVA